MKNIIRSRFFSLSLRTHLILLTLLLALPAIGFIIYFGIDQRRDAIQGGFNEAKELVYEIATAQHNLAVSAQQLLTVLAQLPEVRGRNVAAANAILANILKLDPQYGNIIITDKNGDVWASALPLKISFSLKDVRTFRNAVRTKRFSSGEYVLGKISSKSTIGFGYPIINARGEVDGVIAVNINFNYFNDLLKRTGLPGHTAFSVIDYNGVMIYRNMAPEGFIGKKVKDEIFVRMVNGPDNGTYIEDQSGYFGLSGGKRIYSYRKLRLQGEQIPYLYLQAGILVNEAMGKANRTEIYNIVFLSLFLAIAVILAVLIGNTCFLNRIRVLQEASQRLAEGDLQIRISELVKGGEFGKLGQSFDEMARQLAAREQSLRDSEEEYRFFADNSADIIWRHGPDRRITYISPADERLRGFTKDEVIGQCLEDLVHPEGVKRLSEIRSNRVAQEENGIKTGLVRFEVPMKCRDGGTLWAEILSAPIRDDKGAIIGYHGVARDINERRKAEEALALSRYSNLK